MTAVALTDGIRLLSGQMFDYNNPGANPIDIDDIAAALSKVCRFAGHLPVFYSVAQHAVNTSFIVPERFAFTALMHDTSEAFTNDIPTPLKIALPVFKELELKIEAAMAEQFGFEFPLPAEVKLADLQMLQLEKLHLKEDHSEWTVLEGIESAHLLDRIDLGSWPAPYAQARFLARFAELTE